ncbi:MAG TPA: alginate lyase family protein [Bacteroidales bacterium]|nr:alginate lyase family protein [Bacteroidales bacterium]
MISWYLNRLRTFSAAEIPYRIFQLVQKKTEQYLYAGKSKPHKTDCCYAPVKGFDSLPDQIFPDEISIFGKPLRYADGEIDWHKDIFSGGRFPQSFSKNINIRSNPGLSAKNVWEVNRLLFLPQIALNFRKTGDRKYLETFRNIVTSWVANNPYLTGVNWYSNIEINIRLINWYFSWVILDVGSLENEDDSFKHFVRETWLPAIYQHCKYSRINPSRYSSSNNHLIAEYAGLYIASSLWKFRESSEWMAYSGRGLEKEIVRQHSSGVNREEAAEYIQFITDFFLLAYIAGERTGNKFSDQYKKTLLEIFNYIFALLDSKGNFAKYGDEDDGKCCLFESDDNFNNFRSLLTSAAIMFGDPRFKAAGNGLDNKNRILFGAEGVKTYNSLPVLTPVTESLFFKKEGHFFFKKEVSGKDIFCHFDAAPLGFLSIAAHGHADALSVILHVNGQPVFIDSGTYTYHTEPLWRNYFIGTLAHNTVRINSNNQALNGGPTMWLRHYSVTDIRVKTDDTTESVTASHNGYRSDHVGHTREVLFNKENGEFIITDKIITGKKEKVKVEVPFHIHPSISVTNTGEGLFLLQKENSPDILLQVDEKLSGQIINGQTSPEILGWYSESFMKKVPASVVYSSAYINETTSFKFVIKII